MGITALLIWMCYTRTSMMTIFAAINILVICHEMGHYLVARMTNATIATCSIGFGPRLIGFADKRGTDWRISLIPLGGYVSFKPFTEDPKTASHLFDKSSLKHIAILFAGPLTNFIVAFFLIIAFQFTALKTFPIHYEPVFALPIEGTAILPKDRIVAIDSTPINSDTDLENFFKKPHNPDIVLTIARNTKTFTQILNTRLPKNSLQAHLYAIVPKPMSPTLVGQIVIQSAKMTGSIIAQDTKTITRSIYDGSIMQKLNGPIGANRITNQTLSALDNTNERIVGFLYIMAQISINLGIINLVPLPILDGGQIFTIILRRTIFRNINSSPAFQACITLAIFVFFLYIMGKDVFSNITYIENGVP